MNKNEIKQNIYNELKSKKQNICNELKLKKIEYI